MYIDFYVMLMEAKMINSVIDPCEILGFFFNFSKV